MSIIHSVEHLIRFIGEDPNRSGLKDTPKRILRSYRELFSGYEENPKKLFRTFDSDGYDQLVLLKNCELYSMCEHHMLPFFGKCHIAYIPSDSKVIGISKLARLVEIFARRLQIQERIGDQVTNCLMEYLKPIGAACIIEATHMCMRMRGVSKQNSIMITSSLKGVFIDDSNKGIAARSELFRMIAL